MKTLTRLLATSLALAMAATPLTSSYGQDPDFKPPGTEEQAAVDRANAELDKVYKQLMSKLEAEQQKSLKEAQRAWIKWRDAEAVIIARVGGAIGGRALRGGYATGRGKVVKGGGKVLRGGNKKGGGKRGVRGGA